MKKIIFLIFLFFSLYGFSQYPISGDLILLSGSDSLLFDMDYHADTIDFYTTKKVKIDSLAGGTVSFGSENQIPRVNATTNDFDYTGDAILGLSNKLILDGDSDTYIQAVANDQINFVAGSWAGLSLIEGALDYIQIAGDIYPNADATYDIGSATSAVDTIYVENIIGYKKITADQDKTYGTTTGIWFGDGDTGFYEAADDQLYISYAGGSIFNFSSNILRGNASGAPAFRNVNATATVPNLCPDRSYTASGIGSAAANQLSLICSSTEIVNVATWGITIDPTASYAAGIYFGDGDTQIYESADDNLVFVAGSTEIIRLTEGTTDYITMHGDFLPGADATYDIGSATSAVDSIYVNHLISLDTIAIKDEIYIENNPSWDCRIWAKNNLTDANFTLVNYNLNGGKVALGSSATLPNGATYIGHNAGNNTTDGTYNTFLGQAAGYSITSGDDNLALGMNAGYSNSTGNSNIFIGHDAGYNETGSNKLYIDNTNTANPLIYGDFSTDSLAVNGTITADSIYTAKAGAWADYVFSEDYNLRPFNDEINYIKQNKHLRSLKPESNSKYINNMELQRRNEGLVEEVEKLYLYIEQLEKRLTELEKQ